LLFAILGCGFAIGVSADRLWLAPHSPARSAESDEARIEHLLGMFREKLDLDREQARVVGEALRRSREEVARIRERVAPELRAVRARTRAEIGAALRPAQRQAYDRMVERYEAKRATSAP
jgi:hypothetical protein